MSHPIPDNTRLVLTDAQGRTHHGERPLSNFIPIAQHKGVATAWGTINSVLMAQLATRHPRPARCHRPMTGTTAYDGACQCGGLIEAVQS